MDGGAIGAFVKFCYHSSFCLSDDVLGGVNIKLQQPFNDSCFLVGRSIAFILSEARQSRCVIKPDCPAALIDSIVRP